jgi:protein TonB
MLLTVFSSSKINIYALKKDTYISVSIQMPKKVKKRSHKSSKKVSKSVSTNDIVEPKDVSIDDLFSDVWTKKIKKPKKKKKNIDNKRLMEIQKKSKLVDRNKTKPTLEKEIEKNVLDASEKDIVQTSTANEVNEYRAKIQALVYNSFNPPANSVGEIVVAYIKINAIGKMVDFRVIKYSSNEALNKECDKIKSRLSKVLFPLNPENKTFTTKINLIPEDK